MTAGDEFRLAFAGASCATTPGTAVDLVFAILAESARGVDGDGDTRPKVIDRLVQDATPAVRTRAAQLASVLSEFALRVHRIMLAGKMDAQDPDVAQGHAEILDEGWLVVTMGDQLIGRVPYNPERGQAEASRMAEEILAEHVRLHVMRSIDGAADVALPTNAGESPSRDDGVRVLRLLES